MVRNGKKQRLKFCFFQAQADIEDAKIQLEQEKLERQHKEECEAIRRLIGAQPARSETQQAISELEKEIVALETENMAASRTLELRKKQFALLLHVVRPLFNVVVQFISQVHGAEARPRSYELGCIRWMICRTLSMRKSR